MTMFPKILIANRGEIACRVIETASSMGIKTVAVYSDVDATARHVEMADEAVHIGSAPVAESYLKGDVIIDAALKTGAVAIHPGYGFLSENPEFVEAVEAAGLTFIGPSVSSIRAMGLKDAAKALMVKAGVPVVPGYHGGNQEPAALKIEAEKIGYPVLIKARAGGGGKGMRLVENADDFIPMLESASREGQNSFGDQAVLIEKFITSPRHIEVQVFGDSHGNVVHLFERDCSLQRRHQKVIEEAPAPDMTEEVRAAMTEAAVTAAKAINYEGAGTIEFIVDSSGSLRTDGFWFMEMNTRLQVEHPVTEAITGVDLVEAQLRVAAGEPLPFTQDDLQIHGHSFEARLYAEDVPAGFLPATGQLAHLQFSNKARNDTGVRAGDEITPFYDPMIAKVITRGKSRIEALNALRQALGETHVTGAVTNLDFLQALCIHDGFSKGFVNTGLIENNLELLTVKSQPDEIVIAMAMIAALGIDPASANCGWRLWGEASHAAWLVLDDEVIARRVVLQGNGHVRLEMLDDGGDVLSNLSGVNIDKDKIEANVDGVLQRARLVCFNRNGLKHVSILKDGHTFDFFVPDPLATDDAAVSKESAIIAPMTGVVLKLDAVEGATVKAGQKLIIVEAMKMEVSLEAPRDGVIASIHCEVGASVEGGIMLLQLEDIE